MQADRLVRAQYRSHPDEWKRDGRPAGFFFWPAGFRRRFPSRWLFRTPSWVRTSPQYLGWLRRYRLCVLVWNILCILIMVIAAMHLFAKRTSNHARQRTAPRFAIDVLLTSQFILPGERALGAVADLGSR